MEKKLKQLFGYQTFGKNDHLAALIADTESRYENALSEDDLAFVSAAGEAETPVRPPRLPVGVIIPEVPADED